MRLRSPWPGRRAAARAHARAALAKWDIVAESVVDTVELLVSELVTNAVRHAAGPSPVPRLRLVPDESELDLDALERGSLAEDLEPFQLLMHERLEATLADYLSAVREALPPA